MALVILILLVVMFLAEYVTGVDTWLFFTLLLIIIACGVYVALKIDKENNKYW